MATIVFLLRRFLAQRLLGVAIVVTLGFSIGVLVAGPIYADASREAIWSSAQRSSSVSVRDVRFAVYGEGGFPFEDADRQVTAALRSLPVRTVVRQGLATGRLVVGDVSLSLPILFRDGAAGHLLLQGRASRCP